MSKEEKDKIKEYRIKKYQQMIQYKKEALQKKTSFVFTQYKMSEKTLKFDNSRVDKKESLKFKHPIDLVLINRR